MSGETHVKLAARDWIWLMTIVVGAAVANMRMIYSVSNGLNRDMIMLDEKWQESLVRSGDPTGAVTSLITAAEGS